LVGGGIEERRVLNESKINNIAIIWSNVKVILSFFIILKHMKSGGTAPPILNFGTGQT
jgi:hypothetical protein